MGLLTLLFPIFLALVLIIVLFGVIYLIKRRESEIKEERKALFKKIQDIPGIDEVIDVETFEEEIEEILEEDEFRFPCLIEPYSNGTCDPGYKIETGKDTDKRCCYPEASKKPSKFERDFKLATKIIKEILITIFVGEIMERLVKKLTTVGAAKVGGKASAKAAAKVAARRAALAAKGAAMGIKTALKTGGKALSKAVIGGPVGAAFLAFDIVSMVADIMDLGGYASYIPQDTFKNLKNAMDIEFEKNFTLENLEFPMIYPLGQIYGKPYETAIELGYAKLIDKYFVSDMELEKNSEYKKAFDDYVDAIVESIANETDEPELPKKLEDYAVKITEDRYTERDEIIYDAMKNLIPLGEIVTNTQLYPKISSPTTIGITLSQEGARRMNNKNKPKWLNDEYDELAAIYTDKYYVIDTGATGQTANNPIMKEKTLAEKTVLATGYGGLFSLCEKRRKIKSSSAAITPTNYGSYFDFENSKCVFTKELCTRYGLDWKPDENDCKITDEQKFYELVFGSTVVRHIKTTSETRSAELESGDLNRIIPAVIDTVINPFGIDDSNGQGLLDVTVGMSRDEFLETITGSNLVGMEESNDAIEDAFGEVWEYAVEKNPLSPVYWYNSIF